MHEPGGAMEPDVVRAGDAKAAEHTRSGASRSLQAMGLTAILLWGVALGSSGSLLSLLWWTPTGAQAVAAAAWLAALVALQAIGILTITQRCTGRRRGGAAITVAAVATATMAFSGSFEPGPLFAFEFDLGAFLVSALMLAFPAVGGGLFLGLFLGPAGLRVAGVLSGTLMIGFPLAAAAILMAGGI